MFRKSGVMLVALLVATAQWAPAQVTGVPSFNAPYRAFAQHEFGGTLSFPNGTDFALEGQYRFGYKRFDIGFRGGILEPDNEALSTRVLLGVTVRQRVITHTEDFPLDGAIVFGLGAQLFDVPDPPGSTVFVPFGLSLGRRLDLEGSQVSIIPYAEPMIALVMANDVFGDFDADLSFALGIGADFRLSRRFDVRASAGLGDDPFEGFALSAVWIR